MYFDNLKVAKSGAPQTVHPMRVGVLHSPVTSTINEVDILNYFQLGSCVTRDLLGLERQNSTLGDHIEAAVTWLCIAQDQPNDGGVALRYSMVKGWQPSYPETTGYIIPTFLKCASLTRKPEFTERALRMADWELSIQNADGSFNGGPLGSGYQSFAFDTGQVIFGLVAVHKATGATKYLDGAVKAGRWLVQVQDKAGSWTRHAFNTIPHTYYTRVAWALAELGTHVGEQIFSTSAQRNADWAVAQQQSNGWFEHTGFTVSGHAAPYTHTIAYTMEGLLETGCCLDRREYIEAVMRSADSWIGTVREDGYCSGTYDREWKSDVRFACLTGSAQFALILLRLYMISGREKYFETAKTLIRFLCRHQALSGAPEIRGGIAGSYPIWGGYQRFAYPNWAAKFFIDALLLQKEIITGKN
jgi:hypothetical protein